MGADAAATRIRYLCAYEPELCCGVRRIFVRAVLSHLRRRARQGGIGDGRSGAVVFVQRFARALRPTDEDIARLTRQIHDRVLRFLRRREKLDEEADIEGESDDALAACYAASVQGRIAFGEAAGWHVPRIVDPGKATTLYNPGKLCAQHGSFTLHAKVRVAACARERLEKLCRHVARLPIAQERLSVISDGRVLCRLTRPYRDGSTHVLFELVVFLERLAGLVPGPRRHLVTYHGVWGRRHRIGRGWSRRRRRVWRVSALGIRTRSRWGREKEKKTSFALVVPAGATGRRS